MKTWLILLVALLLTTKFSDAAHIQDGVIIQKIGWTYVFVFPTESGRIKATDNPAGVISIGRNIQVAYALKIVRSGSARFIGFYGSGLAEPKLKVVQTNQLFGFEVKDKSQPNLQIHIEPSFMAKVKDKLQEKIVREGNLNVTLSHEKYGFKVVRVTLD